MASYQLHRSKMAATLLRVCVFVCVCSGLQGLITDENDANQFMKELDTRYSYECNREMRARWDYVTDVTNTNKEELANEAAVRYLAFKADAALNSSQYGYQDFTDIDLYRRFRFLSKQGPGALDDLSLNQYKSLQANMETIYSTATICDYYSPTQCDLQLEPDIENILATSENWDELKYVWEQWRDNSGKLMRQDFIQFVELSNQAAVLDGFADTGDYWLNAYTVDDREAQTYTHTNTLTQQQFREMLSGVWNVVSEGLYKKLHSYVRMRLQEVYPGKIDPKGHMPAHILGDMWAQDWTNIARFVMPFPDYPSYDVTQSMNDNGWDIKIMFEAAEDFFTSIGLYNMTQNFREYSVVNETAWGKPIVCHASAEDFCLGPDGDDYRIKMCTDVNMVDLVTVHHEMGHIEYFMTYKNQPHVFRESANPGFHEAIGDLIALSVSTPQHLETILGLTPTKQHNTEKEKKEGEKEVKYTEQEMKDLNFLMKMALEKIAFLPFGYLIDEYRWSVYEGTTTDANLNAAWWQLRETLQGVSPPEGTRGEEFFDPGAKYHVPANVPYIRYFVSFIVQFQFHKTLCAASGNTGPLHTCDIYGNTAAGDILRSSMAKGFSEPWPKVLSELGGTQDLDPNAIIEYFQPLITYLDQALMDAGQCIGWAEDCNNQEVNIEQDYPTYDDEHSDDDDDDDDYDYTTSFTTTDDPSLASTTIDSSQEDEARIEMQRMNDRIIVLVREASYLDWQYNTNISDESAESAAKAWEQVSIAYNEEYVNVITHYDYQNFQDVQLKRQFELQMNRGSAALDPVEFDELTSVSSAMTSIFGTVKVCPFDNKDCNEEKDGLDIDTLEVLMSNVTQDNLEALLYYWESWRDVSGKKMVDDYKKYVQLTNLAATKNGFENAASMWREAYVETDYPETEFLLDLENLWEDLKPLYMKLHAYCRQKLIEALGEEEIGESGLLPAHLLGNMWAQSWENIYELVKPFPNASITDITEDLENNIDDVREMFSMSEEFFTSLGLYHMTPDFRQNSLFEAPSDGRDVICHASAWDFYSVIENRQDGEFRIKMCTDKNQEDFIVIHHEMGHIEYQMAYSVPTEDRPLVFRDGANPGFHEAIGDTIALSVSTPSHLSFISDQLQSGKTQPIRTQDRNAESDYEEDINFLMKTALAKVAFVPYAYILDNWRWDIFSNTEKEDNYNEQWWEKRLNVTGIYPPVERYPKSDFDPGSKYHVPAGVPYIRYFISHILQFQFHERLCEFVLTWSDIYNCDIYGNKEAGNVLETMLKKGSSENWRKQLSEFLDVENGNMNSTSMLEYFSPLEDFLDRYLEENDVQLGWTAPEVNEYMKTEVEDIPPIVPIVVGCILAVMVCGVLVAYFVGRGRQKKMAEKKRDEKLQEEAGPEKDNPLAIPLEEK